MPYYRNRLVGYSLVQTEIYDSANHYLFFAEKASTAPANSGGALGSQIDAIGAFILHKALVHLGQSQASINIAQRQVREISLEYDAQPYGTLFVLAIPKECLHSVYPSFSFGIPKDCMHMVYSSFSKSNSSIQEELQLQGKSRAISKRD